MTSILAYHLREWLWKQYETQIKLAVNVSNEQEYNHYVNVNCSYFPVIHEICNGSKHFNLTPDKVQASGLEGGAFSPDFSPAFQIGELIVDTGNAQIKVLDLLSDVVNFYQSLFSQIGISR